MGPGAERVAAFLAAPRNMIIATIRRDGRPQMTPVWFHWDGERFYVSVVRSSAKARNIRRDRRLQLLFDDPRGSLIVDGTAEAREDHERDIPHFRAIREKYGMAPEGESEIRDRLRREERVLLVITPDRPPAEWLGWLDG